MATARTTPHAANWATGGPRDIPVPPAQPTEFEQLTQQLGMATAPHLWPYDRTVRKWVHTHKNSRYVPESLLDALDERVLGD
jgi:hypothetical protein